MQIMRLLSRRAIFGKSSCDSIVLHKILAFVCRVECIWRPVLLLIDFPQWLYRENAKFPIGSIWKSQILLIDSIGRLRIVGHKSRLSLEKYGTVICILQIES